MLSVKRGGIKYYFLSLGMIRLGIEPRSPGPLGKTPTHLANGPVLNPGLKIRTFLICIDKILFLVI